MGTPWLGSPVFSLARNASRWIACGPVASLSEAGALANMRVIPASNQARVFYANFYDGGEPCLTYEQYANATCEFCLYASEVALVF